MTHDESAIIADLAVAYVAARCEAQRLRKERSARPNCERPSDGGQWCHAIVRRIDAYCKPCRDAYDLTKRYHTAAGKQAAAWRKLKKAVRYMEETAILKEALRRGREAAEEANP